MGLPEQLKALAVNQLNQWGADVSLKSSTYTFDPVAQSASDTPTMSTIKAILEAYKSREITGLIQAGDMKVTIANNGNAPSLNDIVTFDSTDWNIVNIETVLAKSIPVLYVLTVRK